MLMLTRGIGDSIVVPQIKTEIKIVDLRGRNVKIGINAPKQLKFFRKELDINQSVLNVDILSQINLLRQNIHNPDELKRIISCLENLGIGD